MAKRFGLIVLSLFWLAWTASATAQIPDKYTNLKILPKKIAKRDLIQTMRGFARSLGVRCPYCHVGEGRDLSTYDFASDKKPTKAIARLMLKMVNDINKNHMKKVHKKQDALSMHEEGEPHLNVTCYACHRGRKEPDTRLPPEEEK